MLPRLSSEEAIHQANVTAVGTGSLEKEDRRAVVAGWSKHAHAHQPRRLANQAQLRARGIGVRVVPKRP